VETISLLKKDALIAILLIMLAAVASYSAGEHLNTEGLRKDNVWFQADIGRVYENMTKRSSNHYRTEVHPLFSLTTAPLVHGLSKLGITKETAVRMLVAGVAGIWLAAFYLVLRLLRIRVTDALVFTIMISLSAATLFWSTVPETYLFGSLTLLLVLGLVALSEARNFAAVYWAAISALSLSMTVTNWMAGITATLASNSLRKTARITIDGFVVVTVLWAIQKELFPSSEFFLFSLEERDYVFLKDAGGLTEKATVFFSHSIVMPEVQILKNRWDPSWPFFSVQFSALGSTGPLGLSLSVIWGILLIFGAWTAWLQPAFRKFKIVLALIIGGQLLLHMIYGDETFLYSMHWTPLLVFLSAFGLSSIHRPWVLGLAVLFVLGLGLNNVRQFERVSSELSSEKYGDVSSSQVGSKLAPKQLQIAELDH